MRKSKSKSVAMVLLALMLSGCAAPSGPEGALPELIVTFLEVGAADCILLQTGEHAAMIDTGNNGDAEDILKYLSKQGVKALDFLLLTHMDKDHIGGADLVMESLPIGTVYAPDYDKGNKQYDQYVAALEKLGIQPVHPTEPLEFAFGDGVFRLLPGSQAEYEQSNDYSIMAELTYGENTFLFAGDAEAERLTEYLAGNPKAADVLKVPHHGRKNAQSEEFFAVVSPKNAVITCSQKDLPDQAVVNFLNSLGTEVYGTAYGTITMTSDGTQVKVVQ